MVTSDLNEVMEGVDTVMICTQETELPQWSVAGGVARVGGQRAITTAHGVQQGESQHGACRGGRAISRIACKMSGKLILQQARIKV